MRSRRRGIAVKLAGGLALAAMILVLAGCGDTSTSDDPFVGTWTDSARPDLVLVISKENSDYVAVAYRDGEEDLRVGFLRDGNELVAKELPSGWLFKPGARLHPESGRLDFSPYGKNVDLRRVSTDTSTE